MWVLYHYIIVREEHLSAWQSMSVKWLLSFVQGYDQDDTLRQSVRMLRETAQLGYVEATLHLSQYYVLGYYGGISYDRAAAYVRDFIQSSKPTNISKIFHFTKLTHSMRYVKSLSPVCFLNLLTFNRSCDVSTCSWKYRLCIYSHISQFLTPYSKLKSIGSLICR